MATYLVNIQVDPEWIGRGVTLESRGSEALLAAIVGAQRRVVDMFGPIPEQLTIRWEIEDDEGRWHWNPQTAIPTGTTSMICIGEDFRA